MNERVDLADAVEIVHDRIPRAHRLGAAPCEAGRRRHQLSSGHHMNPLASFRRSYPSSTCTTRSFLSFCVESCPIGTYTIRRLRCAAMDRNIERGGRAAT